MKLNTRLISGFLFVAIIPFIFAFALVMMNFSNFAEVVTKQQLSQHAHEKETLLRELLRQFIVQTKDYAQEYHVKNSVQSMLIVEDPSEADLLVSELTEYFQNKNAADGEDVFSQSLLETLIVGLDGDVRMSTNSWMKGQNISGELAFSQGLTGVSIQEPVRMLVDEGGSPDYVFSVGAPIYAPDSEEVIGVLINRYGTERVAQALRINLEFSSVIEAENFTVPTVLSAVNSQGRTVIFTSVQAANENVPEDVSTEPVNHCFHGEGESFAGRWQNAFGSDVFGAVRCASFGEWKLALIMEQDATMALRPLRVIQWSSLFVGLVAFVLTIVFGVANASITTRSIRRLKSFAERFRKGNFSSRISIDEYGIDDEVEDLAGDLNMLAEMIESSYENLQEEVRERTEGLADTLKKTEEQNSELNQTKTAMLNLLEDLEEEKNVALRLSARNKSLLQGIGDGLLVVDNEGLVELANQSAEKLLKIPATEILHKNWREILKFYYEDKPIDDPSLQLKSTIRPVEQILQGEYQLRSTDFSLERKDGVLIPVAITGTPVYVEEKIVGAILIFRDISHEKAVDRAKTEFVSLASHQLRTPLSIIKWYAELMIDDIENLTEDQGQYVKEVAEASERMIALVNALLDVSRLELGTFAVEPEEVDVIHEAEVTAHELQPQVEQKKMNFKTEFDKGLNKIMLDPRLFNIVNHNLLTNAIKYTQEGGDILYAVKALTKGEEIGGKKFDKDMLLVMVKDNGLGIPKDQQDKMFSKLFRADNVKKSDTTGTGLGLYIIKSIVEQAEGQVWFESEEGEGTTFYVVLPLDGMKEKKGAKRLNT